MSKYTKLEDAIEIIRNEIDKVKIRDSHDMIFRSGLRLAKNVLLDLPTIEMVRCKDCMLNTINTDGATEPWCYKFGYAVEDTDFCSYGEKTKQ